ncbi:hypothetical protein D9Q98_000906 [Chlorella vulgaris]|uniref:Uncharacterized protein n=1 Tax=Chlorella vulgaris TaxID=3077 RepID=A0A9D4TZ97_CHLVU|nr:hypothetical protein D9Q98_000906 [Chlorella vulgaris]
MQKVKEVAHKMGIGHKGEQPASDKLGSSDQNTGATVGSAGTSDITSPVAPDAATTASDVAAGPPVGEAGYATAGYGATTGAADTRSGMAMVGQQVLRLEVQRLGLCYDGINWVLVLTEDRPVVKERVELIQEHRPVEKEFVVETRATGEERQVGAGEVEHLGTTERVVGAAPPKGACD